MRRAGMPHLLAAVACIAMVAAVAGCGHGSTASLSPSPTRASAVPAGIDGLLTEEGGPLPEGSPLPEPNVRIEVHRGGEAGEVVERIRTDANGRFSVNLPPGRYTAVPVPWGDEAVLPTSPVTVRAGERVQVHVRLSVK